MPAPHFAALLLAVIAAAGLTIAALHAFDISLLWAGLGTLAIAGLIRGLAWR